MNNPKKLLIVYPNYIQLFKQVCLELELTPGYRVIRKWRLMNRMHKINCNYLKWYEEQMK